VDVVGKIQQLYLEGRPVPYLTFMHVFNGLLADQARGVPARPSEELKEQFRAACMCLNVGILDAEGRDQDRAREFHEKVYPAWKQALRPDEFARYDEILSGALRARRKRQAHEAEEVATRQATKRSRDLLRKLGIAEAEEEAAAAPAQPVGPDVTVRTRPLQFDSVDALCAAVREGRLPAKYVPRSQDKVFALYVLDEVRVTVRLAEAGGSYYTVLTAEVGREDVTGPPETIDDFAAEMRYVRMADYAYMREEGKIVYTLKVGPRTASFACASTEQSGVESTVQRIERLHRDLGELVERIRGR
jgi:hypothetical protein